MLIDDAVIFEIEGGNDLEFIARELEILRSDPVDVNQADFTELLRIPFLSANDCARIIEYRQKSGPFSSIDGLLNIPGIDRILLERISPYVTVQKKKYITGKHHSRFRWQRTFPDSGCADDIYSKHEWNMDPYRIYFINEKDRYENSIIDYYAGGLVINEGCRRFAIGRYNLDLGKGLVLSQTGSFFYGNGLRLQMRENGITPYTSVIENGGFFGAALHDSLLINFTVFYSNQKLDARIDSNGNATSFFEGDHVDDQSCSCKDRLTEELVGYDVRYCREPCRLANRAYWCRYEPAFVTDDSMLAFYGDNFWISSAEFNYSGPALLMFGELARSHRDRIGGVGGLSKRFGRYDITAGCKYFPSGFISPKGIESKSGYLGGSFEISGRNKICDFNTTLNYDKHADSDSMLYRFDITVERKVSFLTGRLQMNWRYAYNFDRAGSAVFMRVKPLRWFYFDLRLEDKYVFNGDSIYRGLIGCLEVGLENKTAKLCLRYGAFDINDYHARLNVYEIDLPGIVNNRMLYGRGDYAFLFIKGKLNNWIVAAGKYSVMRRDGIIMNKIGMQVDIKIKTEIQ